GGLLTLIGIDKREDSAPPTLPGTAPVSTDDQSGSHGRLHQKRPHQSPQVTRPEWFVEPDERFGHLESALERPRCPSVRHGNNPRWTCPELYIARVYRSTAGTHAVRD